MEGQPAEVEFPLEFPLDFPQCSHCGEKRPVAETVRREEVAKGKIKKESRSAMTGVVVTIADMNLAHPLMTVPNLRGYLECCAKCGNAWWVHIDRQDAPMTVEEPKTPPGRGWRTNPFFGKG